MEEITKPLNSLLTVKNIYKSFGVVKALNDVSFDLYPGEVLGLIGENGSGKSTVSSIISGMQKADSGEMFYHGEKWEVSSMRESLEKGIGMVVQETGTIPGLTVAENIFLGQSDLFIKGAKGVCPVNKKKMYEKAKEILALVGLENIDPKTITGNLDFVTRKLIEIAKVCSKDPEIIIIDETSTALNHLGRQRLYGIMKEYTSKGKSVIFISHDLDEVMEKCDRLIVLRDGLYIQSLDKKDFSEDAVKKLMVGREMTGHYYRADFDPSFGEKVVLELKDACLPGRLNNISLQLHEGEILGLGGLSHCGIHDIGKVLFGASKLVSGEALVNGKKIKDESHAMKEKVGYVAKDRDTESLNLSASVADNIAIGGLDIIALAKSFILYSKEKQYVNKQINDLCIKCFDGTQQVSTLSGGNKQKVVFGKWVGRGSNILILDCPTRGVDIGVKQFMYQIMVELKKQGKSILLISEELSELIGMSDRLLILKDGEIKKEFLRSKDLRDVDAIEYMI